MSMHHVSLIDTTRAVGSVKTSAACELVQTLFSTTPKKKRKKRSGHARLVETGTNLVVRSISSILNDNWWFANYHFCVEWWIQQLTERNIYKLFKSFQSTVACIIVYKIIINKSRVIIKYWRNTANHKTYIHFYLLKLRACGFVGTKNNTNRCWIWNTSLPYKCYNPWSFVLVTAGLLLINLCTKPTLRVTLQTKFQYSSTLKCIVHRLPYY